MRFRWDKRANRGLSRYHQKHRFASSFGYELPVGPGKKWLAGGGFTGKLSAGQAGPRDREPCHWLPIHSDREHSPWDRVVRSAVR